MAKVYCLKVPVTFKSITFRKVHLLKHAISLSTSATLKDGPILMDLAGNCFAGKPKAGIVIGGYFIQEAGTELSGESQILY